MWKYVYIPWYLRPYFLQRFPQKAQELLAVHAENLRQPDITDIAFAYYNGCSLHDVSNAITFPEFLKKIDEDIFPDEYYKYKTLSILKLMPILYMYDRKRCRKLFGLYKECIISLTYIDTSAINEYIWISLETDFIDWSLTGIDDELLQEMNDILGISGKWLAPHIYRSAWARKNLQEEDSSFQEIEDMHKKVIHAAIDPWLLPELQQIVISFLL